MIHFVATPRERSPLRFHEIKFSPPARVQGAKRGVGSFLTLELTEAPRRNSDNSLPSEPALLLWVYLCDWELKRNKEILCDSEQKLCGQGDALLQSFSKLSLLRIVVSGSAETATLKFSDGWELELQEASDLYGKGEDLFRLYKGKGLILSVSHPNGIALATSDMP